MSNTHKNIQRFLNSFYERQLMVTKKVEGNSEENIQQANSEQEKVSKNAEIPVEKYASFVKSNPWKIATFLLGIGVIVLLILLFSGKGGVTGAVVSEDVAAKNLLSFIKTQVGKEATLISSEREGALYKITVEYQGEKVPVYVSMDGKYLIAQPIPLSQTAFNTNSEEETPKEVPKTDKPKVDLYVMSFCPYGNRAENTMLPVYNLLKNKIDFSVHYIVQVSGNNVESLHGQAEVDQDMREACVLNESGIAKWWAFVSYVNNKCGSDGSCWEDAAKNASLDAKKIKDCVSKKGLELMKVDAKLSSDNNAMASPTLIINGVKTNAVYQYGNSEAYKKALCDAFTTSPTECSKELTSSSDSSVSGGSC